MEQRINKYDFWNMGTKHTLEYNYTVYIQIENMSMQIKPQDQNWRLCSSDFITDEWLIKT